MRSGPYVVAYTSKVHLVAQSGASVRCRVPLLLLGGEMPYDYCSTNVCLETGQEKLQLPDRLLLSRRRLFFCCSSESLPFLTELLFSRWVSRFFSLQTPTLLRRFGARETVRISSAKSSRSHGPGLSNPQGARSAGPRLTGPVSMIAICWKSPQINQVWKVE
jgi:hypothetical protein